MSSPQETGNSDEGIPLFMRDRAPMADPASPPEGTPQSVFDDKWGIEDTPPAWEITKSHTNN
ncbi:hypothetical protein FRC10_009419 [Ceratobasidium sp. 414]|nr:hypothetical protein FRC10_009419 [Ceratobasidium sp. 414]